MAVLERLTRQEIEVAARRSRRRYLIANSAWMAFVYAVLLVIALATFLPYLWMVMNSFKTQANFYKDPFSLLPQKWAIESYEGAVGFGMMGVFVRNSFFYASVVLIVQLLVNSLAAYAFARIEFRGRDAVFLMVLATMMLPGAVTLIPTYVLVYALGMINTFLGVVVPSFAGAFGIFLLRQFFLNIPKELEDAALIDGAGFFRVYWQIIVPLAKPAMITLGVFIVLSEWQSFIWPLVILQSLEKYPITVGLALLRDRNQEQWPQILAGSVVGTTPLVLVFLLSQKFIIGGITLSGLKG